MAANFYLSSHAFVQIDSFAYLLAQPDFWSLYDHSNYHLHPRSALLAARSDDLKYATEQELGFIEIWSGTCKLTC